MEFKYTRRPETSPKARADRAYYMRNRERLLEKARRRYQEKKLGSEKAEIEPKTESPESKLAITELKETQKPQTSWFQWLRGGK